MDSKKAISTKLIWLSLFFLLLGTVTTAIFCLFIADSDRGSSFYFALGIVVAAELLFFAHLSFMQFTQNGINESSSPATRMQVHGLIFLWLIITITVALILLDPENADTTSTNRIFIIDIFITILFFMSAYFVYQRDISSSQSTKELAYIRNSIQINLQPVEGMLRKIEIIERSYREHVVLADKVRARLNTLRTGLESPLLSERVHSQEEGAWAAKINNIISHFTELNSAVISTPGQAQDFLQQIHQESDTLISLLHQRQQAIIS